MRTHRKALIFVNEGFERLIELDNDGSKYGLLEKFDGLVIVEFQDYEEICRYIYRTQLANKVNLLIDRKKEIGDLIINDDIKKILPESGKFKIYSKIGEEDIIGELFKRYKVDLKNPDFTINLHKIKDEYFLSVDLSGDLSKREYKIFNTPMSIKGTTAFGVLMLSGYTKGSSLLDPFCNAGTIAIEAALYETGIPTHFYNKDFPFMSLNIDKVHYKKILEDIDSRIKNKKLEITSADPLLKNITVAKKNAKIAGVEKFIEFRRIDVDWMDIKHEEKTFDIILTFIPGSSKHKDLKILEKEFHQFFYQAEYIIKKEGKLSVLCLSKDLLMQSASKYFELRETKDFYSGNQLMHLLTFVKGKK